MKPGRQEELVTQPVMARRELSGCRAGIQPSMAGKSPADQNRRHRKEVETEREPPTCCNMRRALRNLGVDKDTKARIL